APVTRGVYSADPHDLDVTRAAPGLNRALTVAGSLSGAVALLRGDAPAGSAVEGLRGGMSTLVDALVAELRSREGELLLGVGAAGIARSASGDATDGDAAEWQVTLDDERVLDADYVIVAAPEAEALRLLAPFSTEIAAAEPAETPTVELVTLVLDVEELDAAPRGTGVLVAESPRSGVLAKALTHSTAKWEWLRTEAGAQHPHRHVVRLSYGRQGAENPTIGLADADVRSLALRDASDILGVHLDESTVAGFTRTVWQGTLPGAALGQRERAESLRAAALAVGDVDLTGAWLSGTGLASVVPDALAASARIRHLIATFYLEHGVLGDGHTRTGMDKTSPDETDA
ncbi:MAG: FAD-dependent oxidoreductase, partial [Mycetocola sp.]